MTHDGKRYVTPLRFTVPATLLLTGSAVAADVARNDGGWNIKEPNWDEHACFDTVFMAC